MAGKIDRTNHFRQKKDVEVWTDEGHCRSERHAAPPMTHFSSPSWVTVYDLTASCVRITPKESDTPAWVNRRYLELKPDGHQTDRYLPKLDEAFREYQLNRQPTQCGLVTAKIKTRPMGPLYAPWFYPGSIAKVYRENEKEVQVSKIREPYAIGWIPRSTIELAGDYYGTDDFTDKSVCFRSLGKGARYRFIADGAFRTGPSEKLGIGTLYTAGQTVTATAEFPNLWLQAAGVGTWFPPEHAVPIELPIYGYIKSAGLSIFADASDESEILLTLPPSQERVYVYELATDWYRVTPDGFQPRGWTPRSAIRLFPSESVDLGAIKNYFFNLMPPPADPAPVVETIPDTPPTTVAGSPERPLLAVALILVLISSVLGAWMLREAFGASEALAAASFFGLLPISILALLSSVSHQSPPIRLIALLALLVLIGIPLCFGLYALWHFIRHLTGTAKVKSASSGKAPASAVAPRLNRLFRRATQGVSHMKRDKEAQKRVSIVTSNSEDRELVATDNPSGLIKLKRLPFLNKLQKRNLDAFEEVLQSANKLIATGIEHDRALARREGLPDIIASDRAKQRQERLLAEEELQHTEELGSLRLDIRKEEMELKREKIRTEREGLRSKSASSSTERSKTPEEEIAARFARKQRAVVAIYRQRDIVIDDIKQGRPDEELSDDERTMIENIRDEADRMIEQL